MTKYRGNYPQELKEKYSSLQEIAKEQSDTILRLREDGVRLSKDADRYVWLLAHMGRVERHVKNWNPAKDKPLLLWVQDFIDSEMLKEGAEWIKAQRALLNGEAK